MGYEFKRPDATAMERVLARHPADPEGAVLRLAWQAGLSREEIAGLTWPQVDLTDSVLYLSARKAIAARLGLPPAQTAALLHRMAAEGRLVLTGKRYALPTDSPD